MTDFPNPTPEELSANILAAVAAADARRAAENELTARIAAALNTNGTFLALQAPTNAQTLAHVRALTRQNTALIRLLARQLDSTEGT